MAADGGWENADDKIKKKNEKMKKLNKIKSINKKKKLNGK